MALELTDGNFEATVATGVTLVDFWAPWCGPCRMQGPIIERVAEAYEGKAKVGKLNVEESPDTAARFGVMHIPTLIVFKDGEAVQQFSGVQGEDELKAALDRALA